MALTKKPNMEINSVQLNSANELFDFLKEKNITLKMIQEQKMFLNTLKILKVIKKEHNKFESMPYLFSYQLKADIEHIIKNSKLKPLTK